MKLQVDPRLALPLGHLGWVRLGVVDTRVGAAPVSARGAADDHTRPLGPQGARDPATVLSTIK
eukprot:1572939-Alexandrium_andersonii.AAC.1